MESLSAFSWESHVLKSRSCIVADQSDSIPRFVTFLAKDGSTQRHHVSKRTFLSFGNAGTYLPDSVATRVICDLRGERSVRGGGGHRVHAGSGNWELGGRPAVCQISKTWDSYLWYCRTRRSCLRPGFFRHFSLDRGLHGWGKPWIGNFL